MSGTGQNKASVKILRFDPTRDSSAYYCTYTYLLTESMTVLDVLNQIHETEDPGLSYSCSCRNRHCGLCGLMVNGRASLACKCRAVPDMTLEPLSGFPVLKDLTIDRSAYERFRPELRLQLERGSAPASEPEKIDKGSFDRFKQASRCIECYCCVSACPVCKNMPHEFLGPAGFVLEARHFYDPRDTLDRLLIMKDEGIRNCIGCGLCSDVCLMDTDPADIIRDIKEQVTLRYPVDGEASN